MVYDPVLLWMIYLYLAMIGACMGSFSSAISYRIAHGQSWIVSSEKKSGKSKPARSQCPLCAHQLAWFDLIPIVSWVLMMGRCRYCRIRIPVRYPLIEMCGAIWLVLFFWNDHDWMRLAGCAITLPFALTCILLVCSRCRPPAYVAGLFLVNISLFVYGICDGADIPGLQK